MIKYKMPAFAFRGQAVPAPAIFYRRCRHRLFCIDGAGTGYSAVCAGTACYLNAGAGTARNCIDYARTALQNEQCRHRLFIYRSVRAPSKFRLQWGTAVLF